MPTRHLWIKFVTLAAPLLRLSLGAPAGLPGQTQPREPWTGGGVCRFECCQLGEWRAQGRSVARATPDRMDRAVFVVNPGERVNAQTGEVHSDHLGRVVLRTPLPEPVSADPEFRPAVGDTIYITNYGGEGHWTVWHHDRLFSVQSFWPNHVGKPIGSSPGELIYPPNGTWWGRVVNRRGLRGWVEAGHITINGFERSGSGFDGADSCG